MAKHNLFLGKMRKIVFSKFVLSKTGLTLNKFVVLQTLQEF